MTGLIPCFVLPTASAFDVVSLGMVEAASIGQYIELSLDSQPQIVVQTMMKLHRLEHKDQGRQR